MPIRTDRPFVVYAYNTWWMTRIKICWAKSSEGLGVREEIKCWDQLLIHMYYKTCSVRYKIYIVCEVFSLELIYQQLMQCPVSCVIKASYPTRLPTKGERDHTIQLRYAGHQIKLERTPPKRRYRQNIQLLDSPDEPPKSREKGKGWW